MIGYDVNSMGNHYFRFLCMKKIHREKFKVRSSEVDQRRKATLPSIINYIQEAAWNHANELGYSVYDLQDKGITWFIYRMGLEIIKYPDHLSIVEVETWPSGSDKYYCYRDFRLFDQFSKLIGQATSNWLVFNIKERKLIPVPEYLRKQVPTTENDSLSRISSKLRVNNIEGIHKEFEVNQHHIDLNGHTNNMYYFQWIAESMNEDILKNQFLRKLDIVFKSESFAGDKLIVNTGLNEDGTYSHRITNTNGKEVILAISDWHR